MTPIKTIIIVLLMTTNDLNFFQNSDLEWNFSPETTKTKDTKEEESANLKETKQNVTVLKIDKQKESKTRILSDGTQVHKIRELTAEERDEIKNAIDCANPLIAEITPGKNLAKFLAKNLSIAVDQLPTPTCWVFSRSGICFKKRKESFLDKLDAELKQLASWVKQ